MMKELSRDGFFGVVVELDSCLVSLGNMFFDEVGCSDI
jgi:hypothetical protein